MTDSKWTEQFAYRTGVILPNMYPDGPVYPADKHPDDIASGLDDLLSVIAWLLSQRPAAWTIPRCCKNWKLFFLSQQIANYCSKFILNSQRATFQSQGQYWIEYLYLLLAAPPYMAAANFVVITNGGGCALTGTADIDQ